jgi:hypothetical protein
LKPKNLLPIAIILLSIICITLPNSKAQQDTALSITPSATHLSSAQIGTTVNVELTISNVHDLYGWNLNLTWDPHILNLTDITEGPFLSNVGQTLFTWNPTISPENRSHGFIQSVADVLMVAKSANGSGVLATITFQVLTSGVSSLSIDGSQLAPIATTMNIGQRIPATITNGLVTVDNLNDSPTPTPTAQSPTSTQTIPEFPVMIVPIVIIASMAACFLLRKCSHKPAFLN